MGIIKYSIIVAYDGTDYYGWQMQKNLPSVTQVLQDSFSKVFGRKIIIVGASRTDAGVHAHGQVAMFKTDLVIAPSKMKFAWNNVLPGDIVIRSLEKSADNFHPFYAVKRKTYHYHVFLEQPSPHIQRYGWHYSGQVDREKLQQALQVFVGTHDFSAFCAADVEDSNKVRTVEAITVDYIKEWYALRITVVAPRFLRYMIRRMVGAALKVASTPNISVNYICEVLQAKNPNNRLPTAAAKGLTLRDVVYNLSGEK